MMTVREVALYLKCHSSTIYRLIKAGDLPRFRLGGDWRFLRSEVDKWIAEMQARPYAPRRHGGRGRGKRSPKPKG